MSKKLHNLKAKLVLCWRVFTTKHHFCITANSFTDFEVAYTMSFESYQKFIQKVTPMYEASEAGISIMNQVKEQLKQKA